MTSTANVESPRLTVEYAGICAIVLQASRAEAWLVDVQATGRDPHFQTLTIPSHLADMTRGRPDLVVPRYGQDEEVAVWDIRGAVVEFLSDVTSGGLAFSETAVNVLQDPLGQDGDSLQWLMSLDALAETRALAPDRMIAARCVMTAGLLKAGPTDSMRAFLYETAAAGQQWSAPRYAAARVRNEIMFDERVVVRIEKGSSVKEVEVIAPAKISVGNACECAGQGAGDHFNSYYTLLTDPACPSIRHQNAIGHNPLVDPEHCLNVLLEGR